MSKLKPHDRDIILRRWSEARRALGRAARGTERYMGQPEHDEELATEIGDSLREAVMRKLDSLQYLPEYEIGGRRSIRFVDLYYLFGKLRKIEGDVEFRRRHERVKRDLDELGARLDGLFETEWPDPDCKATWEHLHSSIRHVRALVEVDAHIGGQLPDPDHFLVVAAHNLAAARKAALECVGVDFPYSEFLYWTAEVDRMMERAKEDARELPGDDEFWGPDPRGIQRRASSASEILDSLESKLNQVPLDGS